MKRILAFFLAAALAAGALAGCGETDSPYVATGDALDSEQDSPTSQTVDAEQVLALAYNPEDSLNPYQATDTNNRVLFSLIYQGLFSVDRSYNVQPVLCGSYSVSQDMCSYTFYPAQAYFSDGTALTAEDIAASLNAARKGDYYAGRFLHVESITVSADGGVTVRLDTAYENLPLLLDIPIVKASQVSDAAPIGTGAYVLESTDGGMQLRRQSIWWCSGVSMPVTAATVTLVEASTASEIRDGFEFAQLSVACTDPGSDDYVDYRCDYELWECENGLFLYIAFNQDKGLFTDTALRAALTYAIDRDTLVETYFGGFARSASLPASPSSPYYTESLASRYSYDPQQFTDTVAAAEISQSKIVLLVNQGDSRRVKVASAIAEMLAQCGLTVTVESADSEEFLERLADGDYDLYLGQTKLSANMDLSAFFLEDGGLCFGGMANATVYTMCQEALENSGNYYNLQKTVMDEGLLCPILFRSYAVYTRRGVVSDLEPARDNLFYYSLGRSLADARIAESGE
ncbi:MAG: ABC transporter substrate-binding protein [Firmicutes bacterium]|nr:ABC transporter substrate-binding protein [Bacillota bacterium]